MLNASTNAISTGPKLYCLSDKVLNSSSRAMFYNLRESVNNIHARDNDLSFKISPEKGDSQRGV